MHSHLCDLITIQRTQEKRFESPLLPLSEFTSYISPLLSSDSTKEFNLLVHFMNSIQKFHALKHLPTLVEFYIFIHTSLAFKVMKAEAPSKSIFKCIADNDKTRKGILLWQRFLISWNNILFLLIKYINQFKIN